MPNSGEVLVNFQSVSSYLCDWARRDAVLKKLVMLTETELNDSHLEVRRAASSASGAHVISLSPFYASTFGVDPGLIRRVAQRYALDHEKKVAYVLPHLTRCLLGYVVS